MRVPFFDLRPAYGELRREIDVAVTRVLESGRYLLGAELEAFEAEFASFVGTKHCIGVGNGLDALRLSLMAMDVGAEDEVIVPSNTFIATWLAVTDRNAKVVPVEPDENTFNVDPARLEAAITPRTKVIVPVHLYGQPADMDPILELAAQHGIRVLEDAAQAHGARYKGRRTGSLGNAAAWSFYPSKNLGAFGDGGAVTTDDDDVADKIRMLRNYGSRVRYVNEVRGVNSRLDDLQAAVLRVKLRHLDDWNARRAVAAEHYSRALSDSCVTLPEAPDWASPVWHLYVVRTCDRQRLENHLREREVETLIHYPVPPHEQAAYADHQWQPSRYPVATKLAGEVLSLPIGPHLSSDDQQRVIASVLEFR